MFEDLSETPGEVLPKGQVVCMSPSLRELPVQTQSHGETLTLSNTHTHTHSQFLTWRLSTVVFSRAESGPAQPEVHGDGTSVHQHQLRLLQLLSAQLVSLTAASNCQHSSSLHPVTGKLSLPLSLLSPLSPPPLIDAPRVSAVCFHVTGANIATSAPTTCRTVPSRRDESATWR